MITIVLRSRGTDEDYDVEAEHRIEVYTRLEAYEAVSGAAIG